MRAYDQQMKQFLYRRVFSGEPLREADYKAIPVHKHSAGRVDFESVGCLPFALGTIVMLLIAPVCGRRRLTSSTDDGN